MPKGYLLPLPGSSLLLSVHARISSVDERTEVHAGDGREGVVGTLRQRGLDELVDQPVLALSSGDVQNLVDDGGMRDVELTARRRIDCLGGAEVDDRDAGERVQEVLPGGKPGLVVVVGTDGAVETEVLGERLGVVVTEDVQLGARADLDVSRDVSPATCVVPSVQHDGAEGVVQVVLGDRRTHGALQVAESHAAVHDGDAVACAGGPGDASELGVPLLRLTEAEEALGVVGDDQPRVFDERAGCRHRFDDGLLRSRTTAEKTEHSELNSWDCDRI